MDTVFLMTYKMVWQKRNRFKAAEMNEPKTRLNKFQTIGSKVFECNPFQ